MNKPNICRVNYAALRREEQHSFNQRIMRILDTTCGACGKPYEEFKAATELLASLMHEKGFVTSLSLEEYDRKADEAWRGLSDQISASLRHPKDAVREAAQTVYHVFSKTSNPTNLNYDQEYGALSILLSQLNALDKSILESARVDEYVDYLDQCVAEFIEASKKTIDAKSKQQIGAIKDASLNCYKLWQNLAKYLEAMALADALPGVNDAIDQLNTLNTGIKRRLEARKSNKAEGKEDDASVNIVELEDGSKFGVIQ